MDIPSVVMNAVNVVLCSGMLVYSVKWLRLFSGGKMQRALEALTLSVVFFLLAAIARAALVWGVFTSDLTFVDITVRTFAFLFLFAAIVSVVQLWSNIGKRT